MTMSPRPALCGAHQTLGAAEVAARTAQLAASLRALRPRVRMLGVIADNMPEWVVIDLAAQRADVSLVPLPGFFTLAQMQHAVDTTGMDALFCAIPEMAVALGFERKTLEGAELPWFRRDAQPVAVPVGTSKITFTSGTTGAPKGVCLSAGQQRAVAVALV